MCKRLTSFAFLAFFAGMPLEAQAVGWLYPFSVSFVSPSKTVVVRYDRTVGQLVQDIGYDEYEIDIPDYPAGPKVKDAETASCRLVVFSPFATAEQRASFFADKTLRPANFEELAAFSETYPEERMRWNLVALGSEWKTADGRTYVPVVGSFIKVGAHRDEPQWRFSAELKALLPPLPPSEPTEEIRRYIALVRRDFLWSEEFDGLIAILVVDAGPRSEQTQK